MDRFQRYAGSHTQIILATQSVTLLDEFNPAEIVVVSRDMERSGASCGEFSAAGARRSSRRCLTTMRYYAHRRTSQVWPTGLPGEVLAQASNMSSPRGQRRSTIDASFRTLCCMSSKPGCLPTRRGSPRRCSTMTRPPSRRSPLSRASTRHRRISTMRRTQHRPDQIQCHDRTAYYQLPHAGVRRVGMVAELSRNPNQPEPLFRRLLLQRVRRSRRARLQQCEPSRVRSPDQ